jgi:hypothetical protein
MPQDQAGYYRRSSVTTRIADRSCGLISAAGRSRAHRGQHIEYEIEENRGKTSAVNLKVK